MRGSERVAGDALRRPGRRQPAGGRRGPAVPGRARAMLERTPGRRRARATADPRALPAHEPARQGLHRGDQRPRARRRLRARARLRRPDHGQRRPPHRPAGDHARDHPRRGRHAAAGARARPGAGARDDARGPRARPAGGAWRWASSTGSPSPSCCSTRPTARPPSGSPAAHRAVAALKRAVYEGSARRRSSEGLHIERAGFLAASSTAAAKRAMQIYAEQVERLGEIAPWQAREAMAGWQDGTAVDMVDGLAEQPSGRWGRLRLVSLRRAWVGPSDTGYVHLPPAGKP